MTDRPSTEQQLAEVLQAAGVNWLGTARIAAAAIIRAVNDGTIDPIVPERKPNLIHDAVLAALRDELDAKDAEIERLKERLALTYRLLRERHAERLREASDD